MSEKRLIFELTITKLHIYYCRLSQGCKIKLNLLILISFEHC